MRRILFVLAAALSSAPALAVPQGSGVPLPGWKCARLNATEAQMMDRQWPGIPILAAPDASARQLGIATAIPFVADPAAPQNGYLKTLRLNGQVGWIRSDAVKPFHAANPHATCRVVQFPDGTVGPGV